MAAVGIVGALWLIVAPFLLGFGGTGMWSNVIAAVIAAVLLTYAGLGPQRHYGVALVGVYVVVASFFLGLAGMALWLNVIAGVALVAVGFMRSREGEEGTPSAAA